LAKGVIYYGIKDYQKTEQYFLELNKKNPTPIFFYYQAQAEIKLNNFAKAKETIVEMETAINVWGDGSLMIRKARLLKAVIFFIEKDYENAFMIFDWLDGMDNNNPIFCHYYGLTLQNKTNPSKKKSEKFLKRAKELGYKPDSML
jgi:tetratricopeptide (TPR) repeat protein